MKAGQMMQAGRALGAVQKSGLLTHPVVKMAAKYWWFSLPAAMAMYGKFKERKEDKGKVKIHQYFADAADVIGPILTVVSVIELAERLQNEGKLQDSPVAPKPAVPPPSTPQQQAVHQVPAQTQETPPPHLQRM